MIKKIHISNVATINDLTISPYQVNYIFGGNGAGKTTISNYLADSCNYSNGTIERDDSCDILVYNKNFVDGNFQDKNAIQGIFTIGESAVETVAFIEEQETKKREIEVKIKELEMFNKVFVILLININIIYINKYLIFIEFRYPSV